MALNILRCRLLNGPPRRWSLKGAYENVKQRTLSFFRIFSKNENYFVARAPIRKPPSDTTFSRFRVRQLFNYFESGFFRRAATWPRDTLVSAFWRRSGHRALQGSGAAAISFVGFALAKGPSILTEEEEVEGLSYQIRETFSQIAPDDADSSAHTGPSFTGFQDIEVGELLAKGCNAAVYSARKNIPRDEENKDAEDKRPYNLAVKVMFNYDAQSDAAAILKAMFKEALPARQMTSFERTETRKKIPPHPNIVEMYCAFADKMPLLEDALIQYPQALPYRLTKHGYGRNMTLFLIMKRYRCSLKEYLSERNISPNTSLLILCQLLEGIVHLLQHGFVHRDLKTDNILVDLTYGEENPIVSITDFGCCLDDVKLPYVTEEIDRGGNVALMAPEVSTAVAGPLSEIDYSRSDLWTLGTIAYEIYGAKNPFYLSDDGYLEATAYSDEELPPLPSSTPKVVEKLIKDILHRDPSMRPSPSLAATVCQLLLHAPPEFLSNEMNTKNFRDVAFWMLRMSMETFLRAAVGQSTSLLQQLRYTFCRRIQFVELMEAVRYIASV